ncbi:nucleotide sugar dehydrogenase, partial [Priestia filamentosa]|uniref:nucleotide sugar dehydrogenase n=1 Tax=Priestia filamentosa TaxID=1402861 RepID=UPI0039783A50
MHNDKKKIAVVGLGFVGLPLSMLLLSKGFTVVGIDLDENKIRSLNNGKSYISDISDKRVEESMKSKRFSVSSSYKNVEEADAIIICVPTPLKEEYAPNLVYIEKAAEALKAHLQKGQLVVLESSTFPGTTREILQPLLEESGLEAGKDFHLAYSPERVDPGNVQFSLGDIPKVIGGITSDCQEVACDLYSKIYQTVVPVSSPEIAELTKLLENTYRFINISFINEMAMLCDQINIDVWEVIAAASTKPYGFAPFYPGPGISGHCIPVDPLYLQFKAKEKGITSNFIELSTFTNEKIVQYIVERTLEIVGKAPGETSVLLYGLTYKRDVPDVRDSKAVEVMEYLLEKGVNVTYHDPHFERIMINGEVHHSVSLLDKELSESDCVVILTDHSVLPKEQILEKANLIFDTRGVLQDAKGKAKVVELGGGTAFFKK